MLAEIDERPLFRSRELLQLRVAARRMTPGERPLRGDGRARMLTDSLRSPLHVGPDVGERDALVQHRLDLAGHLADDAGRWPVLAVLDPLTEHVRR